MTKCRIQWIDSNGIPTPDDNDAIGFATCHPISVHREDGSIYQPADHAPLPICAKHAERLPPGWSFVGIDAKTRKPATARLDSWIRTCARAVESYGFDATSPTLDVQILGLHGTPIHWEAWRAHSLYRAFLDLQSGETMFAFRGLLQAREYTGRCEGRGGFAIHDAMTILQNEIEDVVRQGGAKR